MQTSGKNTGPGRHCGARRGPSQPPEESSGHRPCRTGQSSLTARVACEGCWLQKALKDREELGGHARPSPSFRQALPMKLGQAAEQAQHWGPAQVPACKGA